MGVMTLPQSRRSVLSECFRLVSFCVFDVLGVGHRSCKYHCPFLTQLFLFDLFIPSSLINYFLL